MPATSIRAARAFVELYADDKKLVKGLKSSKAKLNAYARDVSQIGRSILQAGILAAAPLALSAKAFASFDDSMRAVQGVLQITGEEMKLLSRTARELGKTTSFTAAQVAGSMLELSRAGFDSTEVDAAISSVLNLSRATGTDLSEATLIATNTLRGFSLDVAELPRVLDILTATANSSAQTLTDLGESMVYAAPIAVEFGMSIEQTSLALGVLANFGIKASKAGTGLRQILLQLTRAGVQAKLKDILGVDVAPGGRLREFGTIMADIGKAMSGMPSGQGLALIAEIFQKRAAGAGLKLTKEGFEKLIQAIANAQGLAEKTAKTMDAGLGGAFRKLFSAVNEAAIAIGEAFSDELQNFSERARKTAVNIGIWVARNKELIVTVVKLASSLILIGGVTLIIGKIIGLVATLNAAVLLLTKSSVGAGVALTFVAAHPVLIGVAVLAAAVTAVSWAFSEADDAAKSMTETLTKLRKENDKARTQTRSQIASLDKLAKLGKLNAEEQEEAALIIDILEGKYDGLAISIDKTSGAIKGMTENTKKMVAEMKKAKIAELEKEILSLGEDAQKAMKKEAEPGFWADFLSHRGVNFGMDVTGGGIDWNAERDLKREKMAAFVARPIFDRASKLLRQLGLLQGKDPDKKTEREELTAGGMLTRKAGERELVWINRIAALRAKNIEDSHDRQMAQIKLRFDAERKAEDEAGGDPGVLKKIGLAQELEEAALFGKKTELILLNIDKARATLAEHEQTNKELSLRSQFKGVELEKKLLGMRKQLAIASAKAEAVDEPGLNRLQERISLINEEFDLRKTLLDAGADIGDTVRGTFNEAALLQLQSAGGKNVDEKILEAVNKGTAATKEVATTIERNAPRYT